jgi:hypothetical protein
VPTRLPGSPGETLRLWLDSTAMAHRNPSARHVVAVATAGVQCADDEAAAPDFGTVIELAGFYGRYAKSPCPRSSEDRASVS